MSRHRTPYKEVRTGRPPTWKAKVWDPGRARVVVKTLFPSTDRRAKDPGLAEGPLRAAWLRVSTGKLPTAGQAELRAHELSEELGAQSGLHSETLSLTELIALELSSPGKTKQRATATLNCARRELNRLELFMKSHYAAATNDVRDVRPLHLQDYVKYMRGSCDLSEGTARNSLAYARRMFELAVEREVLISNPCRKVRVAAPRLGEEREKVAERALTNEEVDRLLQATREPFRKKGLARRGSHRALLDMEGRPPHYLYPWVLTALETGARLGELLSRTLKNQLTGEVEYSRGLRWQDIDWEKNRIQVSGKTGPRIVPMTEALAQELNSLRRFQIGHGIRGELVFVTDAGTPLRNPERAFRSAVQRAGIKRRVRPHDLRHTALTRYANMGLAPAVVQKIAGHSTPAMTAKYVHTDDDTMVQAVLDGASRDKGLAKRLAQAGGGDDPSLGVAGAGHLSTDVNRGKKEWAQQDSNLRPADYESAALTN